MEAKKIVIATESFIVNQGFHLIFNNLRHYQVIGKTDNFDELIQLLNQNTVDIVLISSKLLDKEGNTNRLLHQNRENPPKLIAYLSTVGKTIENRNLFSLIIHSTDSKATIINGLNGIIERYFSETTEMESSVISEREKDILKQSPNHADLFGSSLKCTYLA